MNKQPESQGKRFIPTIEAMRQTIKLATMGEVGLQLLLPFWKRTMHLYHPKTKVCVCPFGKEPVELLVCVDHDGYAWCPYCGCLVPFMPSGEKG